MILPTECLVTTKVIKYGNGKQSIKYEKSNYIFQIVYYTILQNPQSIVANVIIFK